MPEHARRDALDQLEYEDNALRELLAVMADPSLDRMQHGMAGKLFVEHLAVRESAREAVADGLEKVPALAPLAGEIRSSTTRRREELRHLDEMARGVQPVNLNQSQDFDAAVERVREPLLEEITAELDHVVPAVQRLPAHRRRRVMRSARYIRRHSPTHPGAHGRRWYDRVGPLARLHALYDALRGFPTGGSVPSAEVDIGTDNRPW